ncbi:hypothetical protein [Kitasatospora sp. NBC_01539]|uniref:hypothetical protein n=1 Tax=Kitasatospora sp. NBC_01539 TaxID=2903577 RepID=UPI0038600D2E
MTVAAVPVSSLSLDFRVSKWTATGATRTARPVWTIAAVFSVVEVLSGLRTVRA